MLTEVDVLSFKITDMTAECVIPFDASYLANAYFAIERGAIIAGEPVTIRTLYYSIVSMVTGPLRIYLKGHALPPVMDSFDGCIWYIDVIRKLFGDMGWGLDMTVTYESDTAPWLSYLFYPDGKDLILGNIQTIFSLLEQKYLVFCADNGDGVFVFQATTAKAKDYDVTDELLHRQVKTSSRRFQYTDELGNIHYSGNLTDPIHKLGYIDTLQGAVPTNTASPRYFQSSKLPVHLKYQTGDVVKLGTSSNYFQGRVQVTEVFDPESIPSWYVVFEPLCWYSESEDTVAPNIPPYGMTNPKAPRPIPAGGPDQGSKGRTWTPTIPNIPGKGENGPKILSRPPVSENVLSTDGELLTGYFKGKLSSHDINVQAALETLDQHDHAADYAPIAKGVTNGDSHNHDGGDGGQIDHTKLSTIGTNTHAQIDTFIASKAAANGLASLGANSAVPGSQLYHSFDWLGFTALANDEHFFALPSWTAWINDPTGTNGSKVVSNHAGNFQADDAMTAPASIYYRSIATYASKSAYIFLSVGLNAEGGIHIDDGTLNNYMWLGLVYTASGFCKIVKRVVTGGGAPVSTDLVTGLTSGLYGLRFIYVNPAQFYMFKDLGLTTQLLSTQANYFNPARLGFYFLKTASGSARRVGIIRWSDDFS